VRINVIVPSYGRTDVLANCLRALSRQDFDDFSLLCVCRSNDSETRAAVASFATSDTRFAEVLVEKPGLVAALNAGLSAATAEFVAFTDDDAEAPTHWLSTIVGHFEAHPECGAVGGPDRLQLLDEPALANPSPAKRVGVYSWCGRMAATHHHPINEPYLRSLSLKGVNMSFRRSLIVGLKIGDGLVGEACAHGTEQGLCAAVARQGLEVHFVRDAWVLHFCAPRQADDARTTPGSEWALSTTRNMAYVLWRYQPWFTAVRAHLWGTLVGSSKVPGILRVLASPSYAILGLAHWRRGWEGALAGLGDRRKSLGARSEGRN
jgi:cellulose synthase/poly-beta-1,6-N-acetylglucosamine synthase-like glycosyltransferase